MYLAMGAFPLRRLTAGRRSPGTATLIRPMASERGTWGMAREKLPGRLASTRTRCTTHVDTGVPRRRRPSMATSTEARNRVTICRSMRLE